MSEHDDAVGAALAGLRPLGPTPLRPLPAEYGPDRTELHRIAEHVLKPKRLLETGNEIALRYTPDGFGTPPWESGAESGRPGSARVAGTEIVIVDGDREERTPIEVEAAVVSAIATWFALGTAALATLVERHPELDPEPIRLWPEHFDVATVLGSESGGSRANYGASPGDDDHPEPYLYVGPWQEQQGEVWNATSFHGAELGHAELLRAPDQLERATAFFLEHLQALEG
jgi:hypothetical protein